MRSSGSPKVFMVAEWQGLFCCCFLHIQAWALQQLVQSLEQQEKISSGPLNCFYFTGCLPQAKLTNFSSQCHPPTLFPNQTHCPYPQISLQLYYKQIYLSNFKNFGSKKTLGQLSWGKVGMFVLHIAVDRAHPRKFLALYIKSQSNTIHQASAQF